MNGHVANGPYYFHRQLYAWNGWRYRYIVSYGRGETASAWMLMIRRELRRYL